MYQSCMYWGETWGNASIILHFVQSCLPQNLIISSFDTHNYIITITIGFTETTYNIEEDSGIFQPGPMAIIKESSRVSEQILTINLDFIDVTATSGIITYIVRIVNQKSSKLSLPQPVHVSLN